jgi:hypothetical protein
MTSQTILDSLEQEAQNQDVFGDVAAWLGRLVLLYGAPFNYLIPEEQMLPKESLRFFYFDPIWIQSLVQGACSIGNSDYGSTLINKAINTLAQPNRPDSTKGPAPPASKAAAGVRDSLRKQYESVPMPDESEDLDWPLTGFLLRSAAVAGWRGLEVMAYKTLSPAEKLIWEKKQLNEEQRDKLMSESVAPLKALRIEQLAADVMFGLFNGVIAQLVIRQPQEGLHFGLTREQDSYAKTLRELGFRHPEKAGEILQGRVIDLSKEGLMRDQKNKGVIKIADLAGRMKQELEKPELDQLIKNQFTSAEFAVEMIEAPGQFTFIPTMAGKARVQR